MNMEWINANDRLPEVECGCGESVLAISNSGEMLVLYYDGKCWFGADGKVRDSKFKITHWMPLPKKPKGTSMERITSNRPWAEAQKNLSNEMGYSHIWTRLNAIENILGDTYDLDNLKKMVEAFDNHQVLLIPKEGIKWLYRFGPDGIEFAKAPKEELKSPRETDRPGG